VLPQKPGDASQAVTVAEIVLREGAWPSGDVEEDGFGGDGKDG
jgi:hypothetical protein